MAPPELLPINKRDKLPYRASTSHWMLAASGREQNLEEAPSFGLVPSGQRTAQLQSSGGFGSRRGLPEEVGDKLTNWSSCKSLLSLYPSCYSWQQRTVFPSR